MIIVVQQCQPDLEPSCSCCDQLRHGPSGADRYVPCNSLLPWLQASEVAGVRMFPTPPALSAAGVTTPLLLGGPPGRGAPLARRDGTPLVARTPLSEWHNAALSESLNLKEEYIVSGP
jgi:hypothetical protein